MELGRRALLGGLAAGLLSRSGWARAEDARYVRLATGSVAGTYYPIGSLLANLLSRPPGAPTCARAGDCGVPDLILVVESSKGSVANIEAIRAGRVETGFAQSDVSHGAFAGTGVFAGEPPLLDLRALASLYLESVHLLAMPGSGIATIADLRGKRVSLDVEGSGTLGDAVTILEAFGIALDQVRAVHVAPDRSVDLLAAGELDAMFMVAGYPAAIVAEATHGLGARLLPIDGAPVAELLAAHRFLSPSEIPAGTYPGIAEAVPTVGVAALWVGTAALEEDLVYQITRALWNPMTLRKLAEGHPKGAEITLANALRGVSIPVHPGAARFYREQGIAE